MRLEDLISRISPIDSELDGTRRGIGARRRNRSTKSVESPSMDRRWRCGLCHHEEFDQDAMLAHLQSELIELANMVGESRENLIVERWRSGREWAAERQGRTQIRRGRLAEIIAEVQRHTGVTIDRREIQRRMRCADRYPTEAHVRQAIKQHKTWSALRNAGFPAVDVPLALAEDSE